MSVQTVPASEPGRTVQQLALSPADAAAALGVCRASIYNMLARGELRSVTLGRARRIPITEVQRLAGVLTDDAA